MAKRGQGEGTISKRPDGTWWARITVGKTPEGKQKRKAFYGKTRKENMHGERGLQSRKVMRCIWKMNFNLLPAVVLWGISFIILLVQMFRER